MKKTRKSLIRNCVFASLFCIPVTTYGVLPSQCDLTGTLCETSADDKAEVVRYLLVWDNYGGCVSFPLEERPRIVTDVENSLIKCITTKQEVSFSLKDVHKYTLDAKGDDDTSVENAASEESSFVRNADILEFENFKSGSTVMVYTVNGMLVDSYKVDNDGRLEISMQGWNSGVYLIKTESVTYKVVKK